MILDSSFCGRRKAQSFRMLSEKGFASADLAATRRDCIYLGLRVVAGDPVKPWKTKTSYKYVQLTTVGMDLSDQEAYGTVEHYS